MYFKREIVVSTEAALPDILLPLGIPGSMALGGWTVDGAIQGILVTGAAVYGNQIVKQLRKDE